MNPIVDIIFTITWIVLLVYAIRMMAGGWQRNEKTVSHPEMSGVKDGTELMGVTFKQKEVTECNIEEYRDLQARIDRLKVELSDPWKDEDDEEDDDGGGGDIVALKR